MERSLRQTRQSLANPNNTAEGTSKASGSLAVQKHINNTFLVPVDKRVPATLLGILKQWILLNTIIMSVCCKTCNPRQIAFYQFTVNQSVNFVDSDTGAHTNTIEGTWHDVRPTIPRYGVRKPHFSGYLAEYQICFVVFSLTS